MLQRARAWQAALPLSVATLLSVGCGAGAGLVLLVAFGAPPGRIVHPEIAPMAIVVAAGTASGLVASAITRPVLVAVTARPLDDR